MLAKGKSEDEILQHYIAQQGGMHVLSEPPNDGVGRLSWLVPYAVGMTGLLLAGLVAVRWSRRAARATPRASTRRRGPRMRRWGRGWTMSSATSTDELGADAAAPSLRTADASLRPWQFFLLAGMLVRDGCRHRRHGAVARFASSS